MISIFDLMPRTFDVEPCPRKMMTDITETETEYKLEVEIPGFKKKEINLEYSDGWLTVSAEKATSEEKKDDEGKVLRCERKVGACKRRFSLGEDVDYESIKANYVDGVLIITIPKKEPTPPKTKKINIG